MTTSATADILLEGLDRKVGGRIEAPEPRRSPVAGRDVRVGRHPRRHPAGRPSRSWTRVTGVPTKSSTSSTARRCAASSAAPPSPTPHRSGARPHPSAAPPPWPGSSVAPTTPSVGYRRASRSQDLLAWFDIKGCGPPARRTAAARQRRRPTPAVRNDGPRHTRSAHRREAAGRHHHRARPLAAAVTNSALTRTRKWRAVQFRPDSRRGRHISTTTDEQPEQHDPCRLVSRRPVLCRLVVGDTGIEPVTPTVSRNSRVRWLALVGVGAQQSRGLRIATNARSPPLNAVSRCQSVAT